MPLLLSTLWNYTFDVDTFWLWSAFMGGGGHPSINPGLEWVFLKFYLHLNTSN